MTYTELQDTYKIAHSRAVLKVRGESEDDYDVIVECCGHGYAHTKYRVIKNAPGLSYDDLALICDSGNLPFGYRVEAGGIICVYTD